MENGEAIRHLFRSSSNRSSCIGGVVFSIDVDSKHGAQDAKHQAFFKIWRIGSCGTFSTFLLAFHDFVIFFSLSASLTTTTPFKHERL